MSTATTVSPFLMFEGRAEEAMNFYVSLFDDGKVLEILRYGAGEPGKEGSVKRANFLDLRADRHLHRQPDKAWLHLHAGNLAVRYLQLRRSDRASERCTLR